MRVGAATARVGLISDTHGLLRPEALDFLRGSDFIVHGGDIGHAAILEQLAGLAPLTVVRGNNDRDVWAREIPETAWLTVGDVQLLAIHDLAQRALQPPDAGVHVVVSGHTHKPSVREEGGVLFVNPGSAGPRRFSLPISVGELLITGTQVRARTVVLDTSPAAAPIRRS